MVVDFLTFMSILLFFCKNGKASFNGGNKVIYIQQKEYSVKRTYYLKPVSFYPFMLYRTQTIGDSIRHFSPPIKHEALLYMERG